MLPSITEVRLALGIADSQKFCFRFLVVGDVNTKNFDVRGRCAWENSDKAKPYDSETYPRIVNWNNETYDTINLGPGDALEMLLVYDPANSEKIGTYPMRYTARLINHQWE